MYKMTMFPIKIPLSTLKDKTKSINWKETECIRIRLPLFNPNHKNKVDFTDIIQGEIGSCWFLSALISYIRPNEKNISTRSIDIFNSIKVYQQSDDRTIYKIRLDGKKLIVDDYIPLTYHKETIKDSNLKCIWFILFEKAMLSLMTYYKDNSIINNNVIYTKDINIKHGEMKAATIGIGYLIPGRNKYYCLHKKDRSPSLNHIEALSLYNKFKEGHHIMANTARITYPNTKFPFKGSVTIAGGISSHCYTIMDMKYCKERNTYLLTIQNPWGRKEIAESKNNFSYPEGHDKDRGISVITWERFHHLFACVHLSE